MKKAIAVTREESFANWYQEVIREADLAEHSGVRGCMIIKPWGYAIWERIQRGLDERIRATGHDNCYFPLFIPVELIQKEAEHVAGFAKEMAVVTHHRLVTDEEGRLVPAAPLESPLIVRPTSETMIGEAFARWIQSYRDLPIKINQWGNVVRWELRPRLFLRTSEFLWQEGHTAHATREEALEETHTMLGVYREVVEGDMRIPVIPGEKTASERFPGAEETHSIEAMMQDGRALQAGTSHFLGQNFARAANIQFQDRDSALRFVFTTSWGASTRLIGAMIMTHSDDDGLRLPPRMAPHHVVFIPILRDPSLTERVINACRSLAGQLSEQRFAGEPVRAYVDLTEDTPGQRRWSWIKKGVPLICEIGPRDLEGDQVTVTRRTAVHERKETVAMDTLVAGVSERLKALDERLYDDACAYREARTRRDIERFEDFAAFFAGEDGGGFVHAKWSGDRSTEGRLGALGVTIRCLPHTQSGTTGRCVLSGAPATLDAVFAKAY